jgi:hypothetical protein
MSCAHCPHCQALADPVGRLRAACEAQGIDVAWDGTISEADAATLLHRSTSALKDWRLGRCGLSLDFVRIGNRARYTLAAIADFMERSKKDGE